MTIVIYGERCNNQTFQEVNSSSTNKVSLIISEDFINIERLELRFNRYNQLYTDLETTFSELQLEIGDPTEYEECSYNDYTFEVDPLYKLSKNVYDVFKRDGIYRSVNKGIIDGSGGWSIASEGDTINGISIYGNPFSDIKVDSNKLLLCNKFRFIPRNKINSSSINFITSGSGSTIVINIDRSKLENDDVNGFKEYLKSDPINVLYELNNQTIETLNEKHINTYDEITTNYEEQNLLSDNNIILTYLLNNGLNDVYENKEFINKFYDKIYDMQIDQNGIRSIVGDVSDKQNALEGNYEKLLGEFSTYKENKDSFEWNLYKTLYGDTSTQDDPRNFNDKRLTFKSMRLDDTGLSIIDSESPFSSTLNTESVQFKYYNDVVGEYNKDGASITNLKVTETSILGHLRINKVIESYGAQNPRKRTRIYWIGGQ
jgi:hypothetical protein